MNVPEMTALQLASAISAGELTAREAVDACLEAVDRTNDDVNAVIWRDDDAARAAADAFAGSDLPFGGVPIPVKDLNSAAGQPVFYGSRGAPEGTRDEDEPVIAALRRAGFIPTGRTNVPEFGVIPIAENLRFGVSRNPWNTERSPGGSSGGAAAAVAAGMFPAAHANDGGGSIRIPASCCGLVGLKPSRGRVPRAVQSWEGAVVEGVVTRDVADTAAILDQLATDDPAAWMQLPRPERPYSDEVGADPGRLRLGLMATGPQGLPIDEECATAARNAARALEQLGHEIVEVDVPTLSEELTPAFIVLTRAGLADYEDVDWTKVEPHIVAQHASAEQVSSLAYIEAGRVLQLASRELLARWNEFDVLITPTMAIAPPPAGDVVPKSHATPDEPVLEVIQMVAFAAFANITGQPAISLPLHWSAEGLPVGVQLVGAPAREDILLRLSGQLEQALPWADRRPPVWAGQQAPAG
jgi:amidase